MLRSPFLGSSIRQARCGSTRDSNDGGLISFEDLLVLPLRVE